MKAIGLAFRMCANASEVERWPDLAPNGRIWAPDLASIFPKFLQDPALLVAREHPDARHLREFLRAALTGPKPDYHTAEGLMAQSFSYLGSAVLDESEFRRLFEARTLGLLATMRGEATSMEQKRLYLPFREGGERDPEPSLHCLHGSGPAMSSIPVLIETWQWKHDREPVAFEGAHVLFMDGHVERVPLGIFPVVPSVMDALCGLAQ